METNQELHSKTQDETTDSGLNPELGNVENTVTDESSVPADQLEEVDSIEVPENQSEIQVEVITAEDVEVEEVTEELVVESVPESEVDEAIQEVIEEKTTEVIEPIVAEPIVAESVPEPEVDEAIQEVVEEEITEVVEPIAVEPLVAELIVAEPVEIAEEEQIEDEVVVEAESVVESIDEDIIPVISHEYEEDDEVEADEAVADSSLDYSDLSEVELINTLKELLETKLYPELVGKVESIKVCFYKKHKVKIQEQKDAFVNGGGMIEEFVVEEDPYETDMKELLRQYRNKKGDFNRDQESEKEENLRKKYALIEDIKGLVNRKESINKTFQEFRELQQTWREIGLVPQANMKDLWENYHHHVENFYDYIKINKELRDLDLKRNLEEKIELCEKSEALILEPSVIKAFNALQKFHEQWREIGPVPRDKKDELWERFKAATTQINKKHQEFFESRKKSQKKNLDAKTALCEKAEELLQTELLVHKDWEDKSKEVVELQKYWRTIGFAPKKENNEIYERFRAACDAFFDKKREFYSKHKEVQSNNLQMKIDLCVQAESLKDSNDWKKTTDDLISIQKKWKEIGPVPRKQSDIVWKRFRAACDYFFNNKSKYFNAIDSEQESNLKLKKDLVEEVVNFTAAESDAESFEKLRDFQRRWMEIGHVPINEKNEIQKKFRDAINAQFDKLRVEDKERNMMKFKNKISDMHNTNRGSNKIYAEREKYVMKLKQLESDLITLKNNIGFFAQSKNAEALINDVQRKIERNEEQIVYLKDKIRAIDDVDSNED